MGLPRLRNNTATRLASATTLALPRLLVKFGVPWNNPSLMILKHHKIEKNQYILFGKKLNII